jgi:hypothetical protein
MPMNNKGTISKLLFGTLRESFDFVDVNNMILPLSLSLIYCYMLNPDKMRAFTAVRGLHNSPICTVGKHSTVCYCAAAGNVPMVQYN